LRDGKDIGETEGEEGRSGASELPVGLGSDTGASPMWVGHGTGPGKLSTNGRVEATE
jgi:hypothetical protein